METEGSETMAKNSSGSENVEVRNRRKVGLVYDERMCKHDTPDGDSHPENPDRIRVIWNKLQLAGITQRCVVLDASKAEDKYLELVHTKNHVNLVKNISKKPKDSQRDRLASHFNSIYLNRGSSEAAYLGAGSVIEVADRVAKGELDSAFAIVRPPGHHAEADEAMGFCLFNNIAVAASYLLEERADLGIKKILIVDWDVHHGNGTQKMFWTDPRVLFFSVHRHENGSFYPAGDDGSYTMVGEGPGAGFNINVPWENGRCGDADYLAVWDHILAPVAKEFNPDMILLSAGFDAAAGDPLGGCRVTPYGYSIMLKKLMEFAQGKIVLALEGGYNLESIANSALACMQVLLEDKPISGSSAMYPFESTWNVIRAVRKNLCAFWPSLADEMPSKLVDQKTPTPPTFILSSDSEAEDGEAPHVSESLEFVDQDLLKTISQLKIEDHQDRLTEPLKSWRSELSKVDVWYATYGSNMWKTRFMCYIEGGQAEGMNRPCPGSRDKASPKEVLWKIFPHRLFFGRESTRTWGPGGVAFFDPKSNSEDKTNMCLYKITLEQFNDVLIQENMLSNDIESPLFGLHNLDGIEDEGSFSVEAATKGWYHTVVYLGKERGIPLLTMTCSSSDVESFKNGEFPVRAPPRAYANTLIRGLVEGKQLSDEEAVDYIEMNSTKPL